MDGLVSDLVDLLRQHLTTVEDVFVVGAESKLTKNIKIAVKEIDWRSILYYLQRHEYNNKVVLKMYCTACYSGYVDWMEWSLFMKDDIFPPFPYEEPFKYLRARYTVKYLAKGRHYERLDMYMKTIDSKLDDHERFKLMSSVVEGLIINGDIDDYSIANKYCTNKDAYGEYRCTYKLFKHRQVSTSYHGRNLPNAAGVQGLLRAGKYSTLDDYDKSIILYDARLMYLLYRYGTDEDLNSYELINKKYINTYTLKGLIKSGRIERAKKCIHSQSNLDKMMISRAIIKTDCVEMFEDYFFHDGVFRYYVFDDTMEPIIEFIIIHEAFGILDYFTGYLPSVIPYFWKYINKVGVNKVHHKNIIILNK